eukprot:84379_1
MPLSPGNHRQAAAAPVQYWSTCSQKVGHLLPKQSKTLTTTLKSEEPLKLEQEELLCKVEKIRYVAPEDGSDPEEITKWDNSMKKIADEDLGETENEDAENEMGEKEVDPESPETEATSEPESVSEHQWEPLPDTESVEMRVFGSAVVDHGQLECDMSDVKFRPTMMFQTRVFKFPIKNTGPTTLVYSWNFAHGKSEDCPFSIAPISGDISPGQDTE